MRSGVQHVYEKYNLELSGAAGTMCMGGRGACEYEMRALCSDPMFQVVDSVIEKPGNGRNKTTNQH